MVPGRRFELTCRAMLERTMKRTTLFPILLSMMLSTPAPLSAAEFGTAADARSMLERAVTLLRVDPVAATAKFNKGEDGFRDRDLYVFCVNASDAKTTAHADPSILGRDSQRLQGCDREGLRRGNLQECAGRPDHFGELHVSAPGHHGTGSQGVLRHPRG
jgi:hypothetical protein